LDVRADPVNALPWGALIVLLVVVFMLAVAFAAGMVVLLVWLKRRKVTARESTNQDRPALKSEI
jgi:flagellar basal body-associated protein FliL